jgi:hypothetical protein
MVVDVRRRWRSKRRPKQAVDRKVMCVKCGQLKLKEPANLRRREWPKSVLNEQGEEREVEA